MVEFKVVLSDAKTGRAYNINVIGGVAGALTGERNGHEMDAGPFGLPGYRRGITGASDCNGKTAMRNLPPAGRRKLLLSGGVGFRPKMDGQRRRKSIRGNEITSDFVQINAKVTGYGDKPLEEYFAKPAPEEAKV